MPKKQCCSCSQFSAMLDWTHQAVSEWVKALENWPDSTAGHSKCTSELVMPDQYYQVAVNSCWRWFMTWSDKTGLISLNSKSNEGYLSALLNSILLFYYWLYSVQHWNFYARLILCVLAAFSWPSGDSYEYLWCQGQPVVNCVYLLSLIVLDKDLWCSFAII